METRPKIVGVIPARLGSTRIKNKMLERILPSKTLVQMTYERSKGAKILDELIVATDSDEVEKSAKEVGARVIRWPLPLTSKNGTEGVALALEQFTDFTPDIVVVIWGDEPLYPASAIDECAQLLVDDPTLQVASVADRITDEIMVSEPSVVKVLTDLNNNVISFSRAPVPFPFRPNNPYDHYHIIGAMAVRYEFLKKFLTMPQTPLELREGIEQFRILENGIRMRMVKGDYRNLGVNMPDELEKVRAIANARAAEGK
jgi:3-deoxy-manno-octulosonate cytidylyltransferase (CMP-KDO synthetase)